MAVLKATKRDEIGTRQVRRLRKQGLIPAVIYGHAQETQSVTLNEHDVELAMLHGERLLELDFEGKKQNVLIKEVQYDTFGQEIIHVDLARVDLDEKVQVTVKIVLKGTPAGVSEGGVLQQIASEVHIECTVRSIPEKIDVIVNDMQIGDKLTISDLPLGEDARLLDDPGAPVASLTVIVEEEEVLEEVEEATEEPEVIGEKPEELEGKESTE